MARLKRPKDLPDFERPPLYELVLSIQFARTRLRNVDVGGLWKLFRSRYPEVEEKAPVGPTFEKFGVPPGPRDGPQFVLTDVPDLLRYWFMSADKNELLQVQADRLIHNWRKHSTDASYPRYESLRAQFKREVDRVQNYFIEEKLGEIKPNQCEVSYINHIDLGEKESIEGQLDRIFTVWHEAYSDDFLTRIERGQFNLAYVIEGTDGEPFGRLHVQATPATVRETSKRIIRLTLTVRGKPPTDTTESAFEWLDRGRQVVVRAFASLTTEEMHRLWGRVR